MVTFNPRKTDVILVSNIANNIDIDLRFGETTLGMSETHRHLGVILSANAKWGEHVDSVYQSAIKKINALRQLKFLVKRNVLSKIYTTFILPVLEYACEVWGGCSKFHVDLLEKLQLEAARIVTGLPSYVNTQALYFETGWENLESRRNRRKLVLFYKMHNQLTPTYLHNLLPNLVRDRSRYPLRNNNDYETPNYRLSTTRSSFLPYTINLWNSLPENIRNQQSIPKFKNAITPQIKRPPIFLNYGSRTINILHTKLRYNCSKLNYDLFRVNLVESPSCSCGQPCENAYHYFFECPLYAYMRSEMIRSLRPYFPISLENLLNGKEALENDDNETIFRAVHTFIRLSNRF